MNQSVLSLLQQVVDLKKRQEQLESDSKKRKAIGFSRSSIQKAITQIQELTYNIDKSNVSKLKCVKGIGTGIIKRIQEILDTDGLQELQGSDLHSEIVMELTQVPGIGIPNAQRLIKEYNITSLKDLRQRFERGELLEGKHQLSHQMVIGLRHYSDLQCRIPRKEIDDIYSYLKQQISTISKRIKVKICGSYRRGHQKSGDIDVLVTHPTMESETALNRIVKKLSGFLIDNLTQKHTTKYMGICKMQGYTHARHIDIRFIKPESWYLALLYFTGSKELNILMRNNAIRKGLKLNEYHLTRDDQVVQVDSEKHVFKLLDMKYLSPSKRDI